MFFLSINVLIIILSVILLLFCNKTYNEDVLYCTIFLSLISLILFLISNIKNSNFKYKYIRTTYVFIFGYLIVFFQKNIDLAFHYIDNYSDVFCNPSVINKSSILALIGLCSFSIGNILGKRFINVKLLSVYNLNLSLNFIFFQKILFYLFVLIYFYLMFDDIVSGNYIYSEETMREKSGSLSNYSNVMIYVLFFTNLISNVYNCQKNNLILSFKEYLFTNGLLFNLVLLFYLILQFMLGDRGPIIVVILANILSYIVISKKNINLLTLFITIVLSSIFFTRIGQLRNYNETLSFSKLLSYDHVNNVNSFSPATVELAASYNTFTYTVANIPSTHDYFYGMIQLRELIYSIPFIHRFLPFIFSEDVFENSSTDYCTYLIQGRYNTYGSGSSILADIYLDFGLIGILFVMIFLGYFLYRIDVEIYYGNNIYWKVISIIFFSFSLYLSRSTLLTPFYYIMPSFLIMYCYKFFR